MKKDIDVLAFGFLYILIFTLIYVVKYYDIESFLFLFIVITVYSFPSLITVLILLLFERQFKFKIHEILYVVISILIFYISFALWNSNGYDERNIYPSLSKEIHIIICYSILCHFISYGILKGIKYLKKKNNAT